MAEIVKNVKGFKVIKTSMVEMNKFFHSPGICDCCNKGSADGYLIAVLNSWYCPECYDYWMIRAKYHAVDAPHESQVFARHKVILKSCLTS